MNNAGLPGTGLGGLFYLVLALVMPLVELTATLRGRGSRARWRRVGVQFAMACAIVASVVVTAYVVTRVVGTALPGPGRVTWAALSLGVPAGLLLVLLTTLRVWSGLVDVRRAPRPTHRAVAGRSRTHVSPGDRSS